MQAQEVEYVGFWSRSAASVIDTVLLFLIATPPLISIYGWEYLDGEHGWIAGPAEVLITYVMPAVITVLLWAIWQATPGKIAISARVVDAETGGKASLVQLALRYLGYFVSLLPLGLGFLWVALDPRKQGWHDKLAGTLVVRQWPTRQSPQPKMGVASKGKIIQAWPT
jgi:uncharacterized RDD family membrane protein YckC